MSFNVSEKIIKNHLISGQMEKGIDVAMAISGEPFYIIIPDQKMLFSNYFAAIMFMRV